MRRRRGFLASLVLLVLAAAAIGYAGWLARADVPPPPAGTSTPSATSPTPPSQPSGAGGAVEPTGRCAPAAVDGIPRQGREAVPLPSRAEAVTALAGLAVASRTAGDTYCRGRFGPDTWPDLDGNTCSTRQDVLVRQATTVTTRRITSHGGTCQEAISGTWVDAYTGATLSFSNLKDPSQAQQLQIDHVVPLYNAWVSGASVWTDDQRVIFANDLVNPELRAVAGAVNFAKDHAGPESWQPEPAQRCDYARAYVTVKAAYRLTVTTRERDALAAMLDTCSG